MSGVRAGAGKKVICIFIGQPVRESSPTPIMKLAALFLLWCFTCHAGDHASWYGEKHRGLRMANGRRFNPDKLTAASWFYDFGTRLVVTHANRSVVVEITDRGPARRLVNKGRKIDLSRAAFARLANTDRGLIAVTVKKL